MPKIKRNSRRGQLYQSGKGQKALGLHKLTQRVDETTSAIISSSQKIRGKHPTCVVTQFVAFMRNSEKIMLILNVNLS